MDQKDRKTLDALYSGAEHIYLASGDEISDVEERIHYLEKQNLPEEVGLLTVVGGMAALNYVHAVAPKRIVFFDVNPHCIHWAEIVLHYIARSPDIRSFLTSLFFRPFPDDLSRLYEEAVWRTPFQENLFNQIQSELPEHLRTTFQFVGDSLRNALAGVYRKGGAARSFLHIPALCNASKICVRHREQDPDWLDMRYCYLDHGWLKDEAAYARTRAILSEGEVSFETIELTQSRLEQLYEHFPNQEQFVIYTSNIDGFIPESWLLWRLRVQKEARRLEKKYPDKKIPTLITAFNDYGPIDQFDLQNATYRTSSLKTWLSNSQSAHSQAFKVLDDHIITDRNNLIEISHQHGYGFYEYKERVNLTPAEFMAGDHRASVVILHALSYFRVEREVLALLLTKALGFAGQVIIFEHHKESREWLFDHENPGHCLSLHEHMAMVNELQSGALPMRVLFSGGYHAKDRNFYLDLRPAQVYRAAPTQREILDEHKRLFRRLSMEILLKDMTDKGSTNQLQHINTLFEEIAHELPAARSVVSINFLKGNQTRAREQFELLKRIHGEEPPEIRSLAAMLKSEAHEGKS